MPDEHPTRFAFAISRVSAEDPDHPASQLALMVSDSTGWQTPRFCSYPQEVTFKLECQARLMKIQVLAHEYKIASRAEVYVAALPPGESDPSRVVETRLGFFSFNTNEQSSFQARELKTIDMHGKQALFVRLVLHENHVNRHNIYNQVGVIAVNFVGWPDSRMLPYGATSISELQHNPHLHHLQAAHLQMADMQLDLMLDPKTAARVRELSAMKQQAVQAENYDEAKRIKEAIERLKQLGQKIAQLEARKQAAAEREDYDEAKRIKIDLDKLRAVGESVAVGPGASPARKGQDPDEIFKRVLGRKPAAAAAEQPPAPSDPVYSDQNEGPAHLNQGMSQPVITESASMRRATYEQYDERPVGSTSNPGELPAPVPPMTEAPASLDVPESNEPSIAPPPDFDAVLDGDQMLPEPPKMNSADQNDADGLQQLFGEYIARCMYSKQWQHRTAAMRYIKGKVASGDVSEHRALVKYIVKGLRDKVAGVVVEVANLLREVVEKAGKQVSHIIPPAFPVIVERLGDGSSRVPDVCKELVLFIANAAPAEAAHLAPHLLKQPKKAALWKPLLAQLEMIEQLIPQLHVGKEKGMLALPDVMAFVGVAAGNANGNVRAASIRVAALVFQEVGPAAQQYLPGNMNPKVREAILEAAGIDVKAGPSVAAEPPVPKRAPNPRAPAKQPNAKPKAAKPKQAAPPAREPQEEVPTDSPEWYLQEVAKKEKELGPEDPVVADCLSNAAICFNQRGEADKALPLYERALKIFEATKGPRSQDVAHLLTDLAVLHLEAQRDHVGRPLLERALDIQREALGEDHPDVIAIKDVLQGED